MDLTEVVQRLKTNKNSHLETIETPKTVRNIGNTLEITILMQEYGVVTGEQKYIEIERMSDLRKNPLN